MVGGVGRKGLASLVHEWVRMRTRGVSGACVGRQEGVNGGDSLNCSPCFMKALDMSARVSRVYPEGAWPAHGSTRFRNLSGTLRCLARTRVFLKGG
jgi:hypothetical protein